MRPVLRLALSLLASTAALPALAEVPKVVTDLPPTQSLVALVMGDLGTPDLLLDRGADAHDFQLRPSQARAVQEADLVVWIGPEMTAWLDRPIDSLGRGKVLGLLEAEGTQTRDYEEAHDHGHEHEHEHEHGEDHAEAGHDHASEDHSDHGHGHSHDGIDPHAWLDPGNARVWLGAIAAALSDQDPDNAATYAANARAAEARIADLDARIAATLAPVADRPFVTFHAAYGYLNDHYGLTQAGSLAEGDAAAPGAERLAEIRATLEREGAVCLFPEAQHDPKQVALMAEGTAVRVGPALDPEGSTLEPGPALYETLMTGLADALAGCLAR